MTNEKVYLGDAVYVKFDGESIILTTENGIEETNIIFLDNSVLATFFQYIEKLKGNK